MQRHTVVGGISAPHPIRDRAVVLGPAGGLGVVVDAVRERQQPQPLDRAGGAVEGAECLLEPAQRARRGAAQNDPPPPGLAQNLIEPVGPPRPEHAHDVAPADVDQLLGEQMAGEVVLDAAHALVASEQRHVAGVAARGEAAVEAHDVVVGVAGGGGQEADPRAARPHQRQDVVVQQLAVALHRETAPAESDDLGGWHGHGGFALLLLGRRSI